MKQTAFDTRQRANELLQEAAAIWRQSAHSNQLEGIERDPIFSLLMTALAYQANEIDGDIERIKQDVLEEYIKLMTPYEAGRPIPATAVVEAVLQNDTTETELTEDSTFYLENTPYHFMSLLRQRIINASVTGLTRLDGRRWRVTLQFLQPINTLEGMTFAIMDTRFQNVSVSVNGHLLEMVKPWHYADMPLQHCFSIGSLLYNKAQMYNASLVGFDLFARQNVALFYFKKSKNGYDFPNGTSTVDLIFDFKGISDNFVFDKHHLVLNPVILVNAKVTTTTLSSASPIVRITGYTPGNPDESQLMHLIPPAEEQLFGKTPIEIRRVSSDRFNQASLMRLINSLTTKFHSDYYAFLEMRSAGLSEVIRNMQDGLLKMTRAIRQEQIHSTPGVYLIIQRDILASQKNISLDIDIVTTPGAAVNSKLTPESRFIVPSGLNASAMRMIADPVPGFDEINDSQSLQSYVRYQQITNDRIVTPADIKILCYTELTNRYSIVPDMVRDMTVSHRQQLDKSDCGYAFWVNIRLQDNPFVRRSFSDKILEAESFLEKRIKVRSSCIYPISVNIQMDTENTDL
jgi:hypothetical protein